MPGILTSQGATDAKKAATKEGISDVVTEFSKGNEKREINDLKQVLSTVKIDQYASREEIDLQRSQTPDSGVRVCVCVVIILKKN